MGKHTPTPWKLTEMRTRHGHICEVYGANNEYSIAHVAGRNPDEREANALLIVRAVNNHEALVEALKNQNEWVRAALECKDWAWDGDQREAAEWSLADARKVLAAIETPANPIEEVVDATRQD